MESRIKHKSVAIVFVFVMLSSFVSAFVITSPVELINPRIDLLVGEEKEIFYYAQLTVDEGDKVSIEIKEGSELLSLVGPSTISVPVNSPTKMVFNLKAPENAQVGDKYDVEVAFKSESQGTGTVGIGVSVEKAFTVYIVDETIERPAPEEEGLSTTLILILLSIGIIIVALIVYFIFRRKQ